MILEETSIFSKIDPKLQNLLHRREQGMTSPATSSTREGEIAVIARVSSVEEWENLSEVYVGATIGKVSDGMLVTGRIPVSRIEVVRQAPCVISLKPTRNLRPMLDATLEETQSRVDLLPIGAQENQGQGALVAVVDYGCDFLHQNFRNSDGSTRIIGIWDQRARGGRRNELIPYGRFYSQDDINIALQQVDPYAALGYDPGNRSHGTHVMDIAAGNGKGSGVSGVAPKADILFIHPDSSDLPWSGVRVVGSDFSDSVHLLEAITFAFEQAGDRPCVVNLSLGTNGGPHDGTGLVEQGIDALVNDAPNRAVVIAASNSYADNIHAAGQVNQGEFVDIPWRITQGDFTDNEVEIWYSASDEFRMELLLPDNTSLGSVSLDRNGRLTNDQGQTLLYVAHRKNDPANNDNTIGIFLEADLPKGIWTIRLHGVSVTDGSFHAWAERDDRGQSSFAASQPDNTHTLGSISTGRQSIVVGSYDAHKESLPLSWFSSSGPTRDGREKPELSAPGHDVWAADSNSLNDVTRKSGTSMATPAVTGAIAVIYSEAVARGMNLNIEELRKLLINALNTEPPFSNAWDPRFGFGRLNTSAAVQAIIDQIANC